MWYKKTKEKSKTKTKGKPDLVKKLDRVFSLYIRLRDSKNGMFQCISCGKIKPIEQADAGHYVNRQYMSLRYNEKNVNAQCRYCNRFCEGNIQDYRNGLIKKYGEQAVLMLEFQKHLTQHYSPFELETLIKFYKSKIKK